MFDMFIAWPMPLVWLMCVGLSIRWHKLSNTVLAIAAGFLIVSAMPFIGKLLHIPLSYGVVRDFDRLSQSRVAAIFVPTAGTFRDALGTWWPEEGSVLRYSAALRLARSLDVPVIVGGGSLLRNQPAEAQTVSDIVKLNGVDVIVAGAGRNSSETARAVAALKQARTRGLILVTNGSHVTRMRAALRRHGLTVVASTTPRLLRGDHHVSSWSWRDFLPSDSGLDLTGAAVYEYVGLVWYLLTGKVRLTNL